MVKYAFTGSHGVGKTTSAYQMAHDKMIECAGKKVEIIHDIPAGNPYWISSGRKPSKIGQLWGFNAQLEAERIAEEKYDIVISDRTIMDYVGYSIYAGFYKLADVQLEIAKEHIKTYDKIYYIKINPELLIDNGVRNTDVNFQEDYDDILRQLFNIVERNIIEI